MNRPKLLIIEDSDDQLEIFRDVIQEYRDEKERDIDSVECKTLEKALEVFDNSFDGVIVDLKLGSKGNEGNQIVEKIVESFVRVPIAVYTALPKNWDEDLDEKIMLIGIFIKGQTEFREILDEFWDIYNTGLTKILGGRGSIEDNLNKVFLKSIQPRIKAWVTYGKENSKRTEQALLRHTLNHLAQLLEKDEKSYLPEEIYLYPSKSDKITTGSIVHADDQSFVVLSPACDLVPRGKNGTFKTDRILLVEIERGKDIEEAALEGFEKKGSKKKRLRDVFNNNYTDYYHWLPETDLFQGGFLNFRKLKTLNKDDFDKKFEKSAIIQISPSFVKDIVSRFSSFYARQGQPDIDNRDFIDRYTT